MTKIKNYAKGRDNNFNLIRVIAASLVLVSHAFPISLGFGTVEPLQSLVGLKLGTLAVYVFFVISGFLITQSFERSSTIGRFTLARILRIFPGLIVALSLTALILGPLASELSLKTYLLSWEVPAYIMRNTAMLFPIYSLPGVFQNNPFGTAINGSLWTLLLELVCYVGVFILGILGGITNRIRAGIALVFFATAYLTIFHSSFGEQFPTRLRSLTELGLPFAIGFAFYMWRHLIELRWSYGVVLAVMTALALNSPAFHVIFVLALSYWTFLLAYLPGGVLRRYNRLGDYSYGIYIYAFPLQQLAALYLSPMSPWLNMAVAAPATLFMAIISWHLVEKPALGLKAHLSGRPSLYKPQNR